MVKLNVIMKATMPFGKFKHELVKDLPTGYLLFLYSIKTEEPLTSAVRYWVRERNKTKPDKPYKNVFKPKEEKFSMSGLDRNIDALY